MQKSARIGAIIAVLVVLVGCGQPANQVTLKPAPYNTIVQMFDTLWGEGEVIEVLPGGTRCTKLDGPTPVSLHGVSMRFYKLECNGTIGYVNANWVR